MIDEFVAAFMGGKSKLEKIFSDAHPSYTDIVKAVVAVISTGHRGSPDPERVTEVGYWGHSGVAVYVITEHGYRPGRYWYIKIAYGSCSGCDTLARIMRAGRYGDKPTPGQVSDYMTLALHIVQGVKLMGTTEDEE